MASVITYYAEQHGIAPPQFGVRVDPDFDGFAGAFARLIVITDAALGHEYLGVTLAHEYFHIVQHVLEQLPLDEGGASPPWVTEGIATYAAGLYERYRWGKTGKSLHFERWRHSLPVETSLHELESSGSFYGEQGPVYSLSALALEWLAGHASAGSADGIFDDMEPGWTDALNDNGAHIRYHRLMASSANWQEAFETAFGIAVDDFYDAFEAYRAGLTASRLPHLADDRDEPIVVFLGDVPQYARTAVQI